MNKTVRIISWVIFGLSVLLSLAYLFVGLGLITDQFYWIYLFKDYRGDPMTVGSLWLGNVWGRLVSDSLISYRILKWLIELLSLYAAIRIESIYKEKGSVLLCALSLLLIGYGWQNEYSPTVVTNFFIVLTVVAFSRYTRENSVRAVIGMGTMAGVSAVMRFPNIVSLPIIVFLMLLFGLTNHSKVKKIIVHVFIMTITTLLVWWVAMALLMKTIHPVGALITDLNSSAQGSHGLSNLINGYLWDFASFFGLFTSAFFFGMSLRVVRGNFPKIWKTIFGVFVLLLFSLFYVKTIGFHKWGNSKLIPFLSACIFVIVLVGIVKSILRGKYVDAINYFSIALLCFVSTAGSDTRYSKLFPVTLFFLPYLCQKIIGFRKSDLFVYPVLLTIVFCSLVCYWANPVAISEKPLWARTQRVPVNSLSLVRLSEEEADWVTNTLVATQKYPGMKKTFGIASFFLNYVSHGEINVASNAFDESYLNDNEFVEMQVSQIKQGEYIFVCTMGTTLFEQALVEEGFHLIEKNDLFKIYSL